MEMLYQFVGCFRGSASSQQVVVNQNHIVWRDGVDVHFNRVNTIFLRERLLDGGEGELAWFSCQYNTATQTGGQCTRHDKASALDTHNLGDAFILV